MSILVTNRALSETGNTQPLKVMTYNIKFDHPDDAVHSWDLRRDEIAHKIGSVYQPDILGLQEVTHRQLMDLEERLYAYTWVGLGRDDGKTAGEFAPIFIKKDRLVVRDWEVQWLSMTPQTPGSIGWDAVLPRIVTRLKVWDHSWQRSVVVFNTHFDHKGINARVQSAEHILAMIKKEKHPERVIVMGDFNTTPEEQAYHRINRHWPKQDGHQPHLTDARLNAKNPTGPFATFTDWANIKPGLRLDYIFAGQAFWVTDYRVMEDRSRGWYLSDHLPVLVAFQAAAL